jgi:signal transduction histidine kinase
LSVAVNHATARGLSVESPLADIFPPGNQGPYLGLATRTLETGAGDMAWLALSDSEPVVVVSRSTEFPVAQAALLEFPQPPAAPVLVAASIPSTGEGEWWRTWCQLRGILCCVIAPIRSNGVLVGTVGVLSVTNEALNGHDLQRVELMAWLAEQVRDRDLRLGSMEQQFDELTSVLGNALAMNEAFHTRPRYGSLAKALGTFLDSTYCRIAVCDAKDWLTIRASGGHRPPDQQIHGRSWPLATLTSCVEALRGRHAVVLHFDQPELAEGCERHGLFSPTTKTGIVVPFLAGPSMAGILLVGEEREARHQPPHPERLAVLEFIAGRIGELLVMSRLVKRDRRLERQRRKRLIELEERQRLARELHDHVGQALSTLLVRIRNGMASNAMSREDLELLETVAQGAMESTRNLAYGLRHPGDGVDPFEGARQYADAILSGDGSALTWEDERDGAKLPDRMSRELAEVIKESVTNVVRHAEADTVHVRLEQRNGRVAVTIRDDGVGFSPAQIAATKPGRFGLVGNRERMARIGGSFQVSSSEGRGTVVVLQAGR